MPVITAWTCLLLLPAWGIAAQSVASRAYTPVGGSCPDGFTLVRSAGSVGNQSLSSSEASYVQIRRSQVIPQAWKTFLANVQATKVTLPSYVSDILTGSSSETPNFAIASSGGGYRAAIFGAGVLNALDDRNSSSNNAGLGGLLQAATYHSGLSGGAWLTISLAQADFPTIQQLIFGYADSTISSNTWGSWNANYSVYAPSSDPIVAAAYLTDLLDELQGKYGAGFPTTFADYWSRAIARHIVNGTSSSNFFDESYTHGAGVLWSSITDNPSFTAHAIPFPIIVSNLYSPRENKSNILNNEDFIPISNTILEFNPFEMGSFDPTLSAFTPTKYLGTTNNSVCITNYDQVSFVAACSSEIFNEYNSTGQLSSAFGPVLSAFNSLLPESGIELDAAIVPNAFYGVAPDTFLSTNETYLTVLDGGEDGEVIPLQPFLVKARGVDTILAIDGNFDVNNYAAGSSLIATQNRTNLFPAAYSFPPVPTSIEQFIAQNLSTRPTFFGCNVTSSNETTPLVIYLANGGPPRNGDTSVTNTSTTQVAYGLDEIQAILDQTFVVATQGYPANASQLTDPEWPACLACAVVDRARWRAGLDRTGLCASCMKRYCWSGNTTATAHGNGGKAVIGTPAVGWVLTLAMAVGVWVRVMM